MNVGCRIVRSRLPLRSFPSATQHSWQCRRSLLSLLSSLPNHPPHLTRAVATGSNQAPEKPDKPEEKTEQPEPEHGSSLETHKEKYKRLWRQYGMVFISTYLGVYVGTLGMIYVLFNKGIANSSDVMDFTHYFGLEDKDYGLSSKTSNFALAWICTKFTEPLRFGVTLVLTPRVSRAIGRAPPLPPKASKQSAKPSSLKQQQQQKRDQQEQQKPT
eukprot:g6145.t1